MGGNQQSTIFSGVISDGESPDLPPVFITGQPSYVGGSLTKAGRRTLTLTGTNTYTGGTIINGGTLQLGNGGTSGSVVGNIIDNGILAFNRSDSFAFTGVISGSGIVQQNGTGTTVLAGANTYGGATTVNAGVLRAGSPTGLSANSAFTVNGQLDVNGFSNTIGSLAGNGIVANNGSALATLAIGNDNTNSVFGGSLQNGTSALGITKIGTGTLILTGTNTYTGGTIINGGTLQLGNGGTSGRVVGNIIDNGILAFNRSDSFAFAGVISGSGIVQQNGTGTLTLTGTNTYTGGTIINGGTLQLGNGGTSGSVVGNIIDNGILAFNRSDSFAFTGVISGSGIVQQNGTGTLTLTGTNTYSGGTMIAGGTIVTQNASALGTGPVAFGNGTALQVQNLLTVNGNWTVFPGTATVGGGTVQTFGDFNLGGGGTLFANANFNVPGSANINNSGLVVNNQFIVGGDLGREG